MDLNKFLQDLKMFQDMSTSDNLVWDSCQIVIEKVEDDIQEIRADHNQGDADDADRDMGDMVNDNLNER